MDEPQLTPPVQLVVRCTACGHERTGLAMHAKAVEDARRCERCAQPAEVLAHRRVPLPGCRNL